MGNLGRAERQALRHEAQDLEAAVELHYLNQSVDVLWHRIQSRGAESPPIRREELESWVEAFEPPDDDEMAPFTTAYRLPAGADRQTPGRDELEAQ